MGWRQRGISLRQFRVWQQWLDMDVDEDPQSMHTMQVAMEVRRILATLGGLGKNPKGISLEDFRLIPSFDHQHAQNGPQTEFGSESSNQSPSFSQETVGDKPLGPPRVTADQLARMKWFSSAGKDGITIKNSNGTYTLPDGRVVDEL